MNLSDSYLKSHDYAESLKYSKQALPIADEVLTAGETTIASFNEGLAYIGLGEIKAGEKLAEGAIAEAVAGDNLLDAQDLLREYANALEHAGYLMMAIQVYHRYDEMGSKIMTGARQRAFLELSAKFDDERRARELELLRRDNALKAAEMRTQTLRQQFILAGALFVACICAALGWAFVRVRRANDRLRFNSERDALTGLRNRRYFNEHVLSVEGAHPDRRLRAARRSRSLQAHQRHPGTPGGRRGTRDRKPPTVGRLAGERQARALGRRGISRRARPDHA